MVKLDGRHLAERQVRLNRQPASVRPLFAGEQHRGCAVGHRRGVARRQGAAALHRKSRFQPCELLERRVAAQVVVAPEPLEFEDEIVEEARVVGGRGPAMTLVSQCVLRFTRNVPAPHHQFRALSHAEARAWFGDGWKVRFPVPRTQRSPRREPLAQRTPTRTAQQDPTQVFVDADRRVARGIDARCNRAVDLSGRNLQAEQDRGFEAGATRALQVESRGMRIERSTQHGFARQVEIARALEHRPGAHVAQPLARQAVLVRQRLQRRGQHLLVAAFGVGAHRARERDAGPANDGDATRGVSDEHEAFPDRSADMRSVRLGGPILTLYRALLLSLSTSSQP